MRYLIIIAVLAHAFSANAAPSAEKLTPQPALGQPAKVVEQEDLVISGGDFDQYPILTDDSQFKNIDALVKQLEQRIQQNPRPVSAAMLKNLMAYAQFIQKSRSTATNSLNNSIVKIPPKSFVVLPEAIPPIKVAAASNVPVIDGSIKASAYSEDVTIYRKPGSVVLYNNAKDASDVSLINADYKPPVSTPYKPSAEELSTAYYNRIGVMAANAAKYFPGSFKVYPPNPNTEAKFSPTGNRGITVVITSKDSAGTSHTTKTTWYLSDIGWWAAAPDKHAYPATQNVDPRVADMAYQTVLGMLPSIQGSSQEEGAEPFFRSAPYESGKPEGKGTLGVNFFRWYVAGGKLNQNSRIQEFKVVYSMSLAKDIETALSSLKSASEQMYNEYADRASKFGNKIASVYNRSAAAFQDSCSRWCLMKMTAGIGGEMLAEKHAIDPMMNRVLPVRLVKMAIKGYMNADQIADTVDQADECIQTKSCKSKG